MIYNIFCVEDTPLLKIDSIGTCCDLENTRYGPTQRVLYQIHYVVSGKGTFNGNPVHAGQGFLITPGSREHYYPDKSDNWEYLWITSHDKSFCRIFELYGANPDTQIFDYSSVAYIKSIIHMVKNKHNQYLPASEILEIYLRMLNSHLKKNTRTNDDNYFKYAEHFISMHLYRPIQVKEITDLLGISQPYLYEIFIRSCNMSPKEYIIRAKLNEAIRLMSDTTLSITNIANAVGYADSLSFSRIFKKKLGVSPTDYRLALQ